MMFLAIMVGLPVIFALWLAIFLKWQRGLWMLVVFIPFSGLLTLALRPSPIGTLLKDLLFVLPTYAVFFLVHTREIQRTRVPKVFTLLLVLFAALVLLQLFNPNVRRITIGLVGVKVWLMYLPMLYLSAAFFQTPEMLLRMLRVCVAIAAIPCTLGLAEFVLATAIGYRPAMIMIYGPIAVEATQNFSYFNMGADFFRIPSTFSFSAQYAGYCMLMVPLVYMLLSIEPNTSWRYFARAMMGLVFAASVLSGTRGNFLFTPLIFLTILVLDAKLTRLGLGLVFGPIMMISTLDVAGIDVFRLFGATADLTQSYGQKLVLPDLIRALTTHPLGSGTGMNTGGVNNLLSKADLATIPMIEGYYAKAVVELGFFGLMLVVMLIAGLILYGIQLRRQMRDPMAQSCAAAIVAFLIAMAIHSFKGWQVDLDPVNVWYWILVGILFQLPHLQFTDLAERRRRSEAERLNARAAAKRGRKFRLRPARPGLQPLPYSGGQRRR